MSLNPVREGGAIGLREDEAGARLPLATSSSRKRKAASITAPACAESKQPLVPATQVGLEEMRRRVATVVEETMRNRLAGAEQMEKGREAAGSGAAGGQQDATTTAYLRAFQAAVAAKVRMMCDVQDAREQSEADELMKEIVQFYEDIRAARERLHATRARVSRLAVATCNDSLRVAKAADDRTAAALEAMVEQARKDKEDGFPLPPVDGVDGAGGDDLDPAGDAAFVSGIDAAVLEPKVSLLIGNLSELPGPLKSVLQEIPEWTTSLAKTIQSVETAMGVGESRTEALLDKSPPTLKKGKGRGSAGGGAAADRRQAPEEARATAREARVGQARKEWQATGTGVLGGVFPVEHEEKVL